MIKRLLFLIFITVINFCFFSQSETDIQLAQYYYVNGEFSKAQLYYEKIYDSNPTKVYFNRYLECLLAIKDTKGAEKIYKNQLSLMPNDIILKIQFYLFYLDIEEENKAKKLKEKDIDHQTFYDPKEVQEVIAYLLSKDKGDWAIEIVNNAKKQLKLYPYELWYAQIYISKQEELKAVEQYLLALKKTPELKEQIQFEIGAHFDFSQESQSIKEVKAAFLSASQKDPNNFIYSEMLIWFFMQSRNFDAAYVQVLALEKRANGDGSYLLEFSNTCLENGNYVLAKKALNSIIELKLFSMFEAQRRLLNVCFIEITTSKKIETLEMDNLLNNYKTIIPQTELRDQPPLVLEYAHILGFYANRAKEAREVLINKSQLPGIGAIQKAQLKMKLADVLVLLDSIWEASLLYMQIDSDFKFEGIGNEAKFKNARIFYYDGEFDYAQSQLNVLKESTSKFISNDAMQLSLVITENYGLDSNYQAMYWFAKSELLIEQHKYDEAFQWMDSISQQYLTSPLIDDILYLKAKAQYTQGDWDSAYFYYEKIHSVYGKDILGDDALYQMAKINQNQRQDIEHASQCYLQLITDYPGSLYSDDSRNQLRILRGDKKME